MKKLFNNFKLVCVCAAAALLISCGDEAGESKKVFKDLDMGIKNVEIPEWSKNPSGAQDLPALVLNSSASNMNSTIKAEVKKAPEKIDLKNIIFMFVDGLTDDLINATEEKYAELSDGELLLNELPVKLSLTAQKLDENADSSKVVGLYLTDSFYKAGAYVTTGSIVNNIFRQFKNVKVSTNDETELVNDVIARNPRPVYILAKDTAKGTAVWESSDNSSNYTNEFYKSKYKRVETFEDALACYMNEEVTIYGIPGDSEHSDYLANPRGVYTFYKAATTVYPSPVQSMAYALALTETKCDEEGFFVVFYDDAAGEDKNAELKNFDEAVIAASKYVLENPDTVLVVTSAALDGSKIPAYVLGNIPETAKSAATLLDFTKALFTK